MYTPLESAPLLIHLWLAAIICLVVFAVALFYFVFPLNEVTGKKRFIIFLVLVLTSFVGTLSLEQLHNNKVATEEMNQKSMIQNINAKYLLDTENLEILNDRLFNHGTYDFSLREESSVKYFQIEFMEDGEPFLVVNDDMTEERAKSLLK